MTWAHADLLVGHPLYEAEILAGREKPKAQRGERESYQIESQRRVCGVQSEKQSQSGLFKTPWA